MTEQSPAEAVFFAALEKGTPEERAAYLDAACAHDPDLRRRVELLLAAHPQVGNFLEAHSGQEPAAPGTVETGPDRGQSEAVGSILAGRYKLLEQIGEGGMGTVWVAEQTQPVRRKVAVKLVKAGMDSKAVLTRFEAERQALALMDHPHIAKVLDGGTTDTGRPFFVMEYVKGVPITRYCDDARLSIAQRLALFVPVCQAVQHAHQKGIIHRDLKPSNVLICLYDGNPVPKVIDFGLAKAMHQPLTERTLYTAHGVMLGTPLYMSPEQAELNNLDVDTRTDIYALGVILYELLTGTTPLEQGQFQKAAWQEMLRLIKEQEPPRPSARLSGSSTLPSLAAQRQLDPVRLTRLVRGELDWIVMRCLEKDRSRRYDTAMSLAHDVERYLADEVVEARPPSAAYRLRKFARKNRVALTTAAAFVALLFIVVGLVVYGVWWADRQAAERRHEQAVRAAHDHEAFAGTLNRIEAELKAARLAEADTLLLQASKQIDDQTPADLRARHEQLRRDERMLRELNDIFEERWMVSPTDTRRIDSERAKKRYPPLFQGYGLAVGQEPAAATVERLRQSVIAEALSSGLTEWFFVDPKFPGLLVVVDLLDPGRDRAALRRAIAEDEEGRINELSKTIDGSKLSPAYAVGLGVHPAIKEPMPILKAAWKTHPDSFPLALTICSYCYSPSNEGRAEAVGWGRTAVALRPNNPLAHYYHAVTLSPFGAPDVASAVEEFRRTIQLAPRFARAHARLAFALRFQGRRDEQSRREAVNAARTAIKLDNQSLLGHFVLYEHLFKDEKDFVEAAQVYRDLKRASIDESDREGCAATFFDAFISTNLEFMLPRHKEGLIGAGRTFEAYRLSTLDDHDPKWSGWTTNGVRDTSYLYIAVRAAALAGCGKGLDAPPPTDRPAIRKHALEWLNACLDIRKKDAAALPAFGANTVGLMAPPSGQGPLLVPVAALSPGSYHTATYSGERHKVVRDEMNHWLADPDLARVRDDPLVGQLPAAEREAWRKLWREVRSLRDWTAPSPAAPPTGGE